MGQYGSIDQEYPLFSHRESSSTKKLDDVYVCEIVAHHGVLVSIISYRDVQFTSQFWQKFDEELGTRLHLNTAYNLQTDGLSERTIQTFEDMLQAYVIYFGMSWDSYLPFAEFCYNNNYLCNIGAPPFELFNDRRYHTPVC